MIEFHPKFDTFPKILKQGLAKRAIADRASGEQALKLSAELYRVKPDFMAHYACVYVVADEAPDRCKIGIAVNPFKRLISLQSGNWRLLTLRSLFWFPSFDHAAMHEYAALQFAKKHGVRIRGEWVALNHMETCGVILSAAENETWFTDTHGFVNEWIPEFHRQREASEDAFYSRRPRLEEVKAA
jgi:hypothetical protein